MAVFLKNSTGFFAKDYGCTDIFYEYPFFLPGTIATCLSPRHQQQAPLAPLRHPLAFNIVTSISTCSAMMRAPSLPPHRPPHSCLGPSCPRPSPTTQSLRHRHHESSRWFGRQGGRVKEPSASFGKRFFVFGYEDGVFVHTDVDQVRIRARS